jgi:hypothetical protein
MNNDALYMNNDAFDRGAQSVDAVVVGFLGMSHLRVGPLGPGDWANSGRSNHRACPAHRYSHGSRRASTGKRPTNPICNLNRRGTYDRTRVTAKRYAIGVRIMPFADESGSCFVI